MNVLLGITGGIAAYKSCELLRQFQKAGHIVKVIMTQSAQEFVTPKTFESLTEDQVYTPNWFSTTKGNEHIHLARWADVFIIAPCTANTIYRCANGKADDLLSTVYLAYDRKTYFAPAMNTKMLEDIAVQKNLATLQTKGEFILDPASGELACKEVGLGKMMEPEDIYRIVLEDNHKASKLLHLNIVITAGPTREYIDPVRFISSPSTGTMGVALAREALLRGATVTLVHGPTVSGYDGSAIEVVSAQEMHDVVMEKMPCDIFIGTAAVADYKPKTSSNQKIKKTNEDLQIALERNPDILQDVSNKKQAQKLIIGFSAETQNVIENAKSKLESKNLDMIVANEVFESKKGFGAINNTFHIITKENQETIEDISKDIFARIFWDEVEKNI